MTTAAVPVSHITPSVSLTATQFATLAEIPPAREWLAHLTRATTWRACRQDITDVQAFAGLGQPEELRDITHTHVIAWREDLTRQSLAHDSAWRKPSTRSFLSVYLCETHAVWHYPVRGLKRRGAMNRESVTPALGDHQARKLLETCSADTLDGKLDWAILATWLYHAMRCKELCTLTIGDLQQREGVPHLRVEGKGNKVCDLPLYVLAQRLITAYLQSSGQGTDLSVPLFGQ
jgi:integrase/recombinase XerD